MLTQLRFCLALVVCFFACLLVEGQNCTRKCHNLKPGVGHWTAATAPTRCYTYFYEYGDDMNAVAPFGGNLISPGPTPIYVDRFRWDDCIEVCANWKMITTREITTGTYDGPAGQVVSQYCIPSVGGN